jgi:hypothetical protein
MTVAGADLPRTLPDACRTPPVRCASTLRADVVEALADGGERSLKVRPDGAFPNQAAQRFTSNAGDCCP